MGKSKEEMSTLDTSKKDIIHYKPEERDKAMKYIIEQLNGYPIHSVSMLTKTFTDEKMVLICIAGFKTT